MRPAAIAASGYERFTDGRLQDECHCVAKLPESGSTRAVQALNDSPNPAAAGVLTPALAAPQAGAGVSGSRTRK